MCCVNRRYRPRLRFHLMIQCISLAPHTLDRWLNAFLHGSGSEVTRRGHLCKRTLACRFRDDSRGVWGRTNCSVVTTLAATRSSITAKACCDIRPWNTVVNLVGGQCWDCSSQNSPMRLKMSLKDNCSLWWIADANEGACVRNVGF